VKIRETVQTDKDLIRKVHQNAFGVPEGETVSQLAINLLEDKSALPILSLVAEQDNEIIGNVIFSSVTIEGSDEEILAYILAPLAVVKDTQGKGVGTALINHGLKTLRERGAEIVFVYGDPNYYVRTGFKAGHNLKPPHKLKYPAEAWMAQELTQGVLAKAEGMVKCASSLDSQELW
jgi:putative acetyltransferase